jgi:hypothetical protein
LQLFGRASSHGDSSVTIGDSVVSNAAFFSQQLDAWSCMLRDEFIPKFISAAAATVKFQPSLNWSKKDIDHRVSSVKKE